MPSAKHKKQGKASVRKVQRAESIKAEKKAGGVVIPANYIKWVVFCFAFLLYADTLDLKYALDDSLMITENHFTQQGVSGIKDIFTNDAFVGFLGKNNLLPGGRYRPLSQVMFAVEKGIFGFNPLVGHLINILLYAFTCMLLYVILTRLFKDFTAKQWYLGIPFITAMLFTAHPLHTEVVANIKGRDELLCLFFSLLTVFLTLEYLERKKSYMLLINFFLFILAILSKENALTFLALLPLMIFVFTETKIREYLITLLPLVLAIAAYFILRVEMIGSRVSTSGTSDLLNDPFVGASVMQKYATIFLTWLKYLWLLIFPHPLTHDYYPKQVPIVGFADPRVLLSLLIFGALLVFALLKIKKKNVNAFGILFFFISFSIVSNVVFVIGTFMNERFMFTALLGFVMILAYFLAEYLRKKIKNQQTYRTTAGIILMVLLSGYCLKTVSRNRVWMDDLTLFTTDVKVSSNSTKCNTSAGGRLIEKADSTDNEIQEKSYLDQSVTYLQKALKIYPGNFNALLLLGNAYFKQEKYSDSRECYHKCLLMNPKNMLALNNLSNVAVITNRDGHFREALNTYKMLLQYNPDEAESYFGMGIAYRGLNNFDSAIMALQKAIAIKADYAEAWSKIGEIYGKNLHRIDEAEDCFLNAIKIDPSDESSLENLGIVYGIKHDYARSVDFLQRALKLKPEKYEIYLNLAETYRIMGDKKSSAEYLAKAQKFKPGNK